MFGNMLLIFLLLVSVTQVTPSIIQVCEWAKPDGRTLSCPAGQVLNILTGLYGRKSLDICSNSNHGGVTNCGSSASFNKAKELCNGKRECHLRASNSMFGDPCWGINKYLEVTFECTGIKPDLLLLFVGKWIIEYPNTPPLTYTASSDGKVTMMYTGRSAHLQKSDNQVDFPSSEGWYKINKVFRDAAWEYLRLKDDGTMEIHHFCSDGRCGGKYKNSNNYCCERRGRKIAAENRPTRTYEIDVKTGNKKYSSTGAKVFIIIYGEKGDTGKLFLKKTFYQNQLEKFTVKAMDVGKITMMRIGHDNTGSGPGWYLANVVVKVESCSSTFSIWQWLEKTNIEVDAYPTLEQGDCAASENNSDMSTYDIDVKTSNVRYAGTDEQIFFIIYGEIGDTGKIYFTRSKTNKLSFLQNQLDKFTIVGKYVGKITKMRIGNENTGNGYGWHLDYVVVKVKSCTSKFSPSKWLYSSELTIDMHPTSQEGECETRGMSTYDIDVKTSNIRYAGTDEKISFRIYGEEGDTGKIYFPKSKTNRLGFLQNQLDKFTIVGKDVGKITKMRIGNENTGHSYGWHLDYVVVKVKSCTSKFSAGKWLYASVLTIDMQLTSQEGECETHTASTGSICRRDYRKIGCFIRDWKKVPVLVITDLDSTHKNYTTDMNWADYVQGLHSLACRCRAKAVGEYKYFGIGFLGECVAGKDHKALEEMFKTRLSGEGCVNGKWGACNRKHETECAGEADYDFFYEIVE